MLDHLLLSHRFLRLCSFFFQSIFSVVQTEWILLICPPVRCFCPLSLHSTVESFQRDFHFSYFIFLLHHFHFIIFITSTLLRFYIYLFVSNESVVTEAILGWRLSISVSWVQRLICLSLDINPDFPFHLGYGLPGFWYDVVVVQSNNVQLFTSPWTVAHQASLSFTISWSLLKLMSIKSVMPSSHLILCHPLLLLPLIFPNIRVFSNELALCFQSIGASASASVLPMNIQGWFSL